MIDANSDSLGRSVVRYDDKQFVISLVRWSFKRRIGLQLCWALKFVNENRSPTSFIPAYEAAIYDNEIDISRRPNVTFYFADKEIAHETIQKIEIAISKTGSTGADLQDIIRNGNLKRQSALVEYSF